MGKIGLLNDYPEVVVALARLITPGHEISCLTYHEGGEGLEADPPEVMVVVIFRHAEAFDRPIMDFDQDVSGGSLLRKLNEHPVLSHVPLIIFGVGLAAKDVPKDIRYHSYLTFPQAIQELNPLISGLVGPAPQTHSVEC